VRALYLYRAQEVRPHCHLEVYDGGGG
jgi:hypothetical protein